MNVHTRRSAVARWLAEPMQRRAVVGASQAEQALNEHPRVLQPAPRAMHGADLGFVPYDGAKIASLPLTDATIPVAGIY